MELGRKEATFFGMPKLPLVQIPHHPSGGARPGEHAEDARIAIGPVRETLTDADIAERTERAGASAAEGPGRGVAHRADSAYVAARARIFARMVNDPRHR